MSCIYIYIYMSLVAQGLIRAPTVVGASRLRIKCISHKKWRNAKQFHKITVASVYSKQAHVTKSCNNVRTSTMQYIFTFRFQTKFYFAPNLMFSQFKHFPNFRESWLPLLGKNARLHVHKDEGSTFFRKVGKYFPIPHPQKSKRLAFLWLSLPVFLRAVAFCCRIIESLPSASQFTQYTKLSLQQSLNCGLICW